MRRNSNLFLSHARCFLVCCFLGILVAEKPTSERDILLEFKSRISNDPYNSLASWVQSGEPCKFYGVFCNSNGYVDKIVLWNTSLGGVLSPSLSGLGSLRILSLFGNQLTGNIPREYAELSTLWKINLSSNALSGTIPEFLGELPNIRFLDLSKNRYGGQIPQGLFGNCSKTRFVALAHNSLSGSLPVAIADCVSLEGIDLSFNNISGELPARFCKIPTLQHISLRSNMMAGIVDELSNCQSLRFLDLGSNMFSGLPPFAVLGFENMTYFNISHNQFEGQVSAIDNCSEMLEILDCSYNNLEGAISVDVLKCSNLKLMNFGFNRLTGTVPEEIVQMKKLRVIHLGNNLLDGTIPVGFGVNDLLLVLDLHNLHLVGSIPEDISNCSSLRVLDVSGNFLSGIIPSTFRNWIFLEVLDLHSNFLNGSIPEALGRLPRLQYLDLSQNSLSEMIPSSLENLSSLAYFNVSSNSLSGTIPFELQDFGASAFLNNSNLCGPPLYVTCSSSGNMVNKGAKKSKMISTSVIVAIVAAALIAAGVCTVTIMNIRTRSRRLKQDNIIAESTPLSSAESNMIIGKLVLFSTSLPSRYEDWETGTKALLDKECIIGGGSIGTVYKATFENGISIAVKKLEILGRIRSQEEFEQEFGRLSKLQHRNLVAYQGYYWSPTMQLLLLEYITNGNLFDNLHGSSKPSSSSGVGNQGLHWFRRFQIALEIARALSYLHHDCRPPIFHLNVKSTNILLNENFEAKLADYGLEKVLPILDNNVSTNVHNVVGYIAPELAQGLRPNEKCDVYSFGVILLELVTGRKPVESLRSHKVVVLCEYVRELLETGFASHCFDRRLRGFSENELVQVLKLGLICTSEVPARRPRMAEVVQVLEFIRTGVQPS